MRVLFVHNGCERFVLQDLELLRRHFDVTDWHQPHRHYNPRKLIQHVREHDLVYGWFASWHSLAPVWLARKFGKPAVVVAGGYDVAIVPDAGYGAQRRGVKRTITRFVIRHATRLCCFSHSAAREAIDHAGADPGRIDVIYLGVEPFPFGSETRAPIALTVGGVWRENLLRKGLLPFVQAAKQLPEVRFVLVGRWFDDSIEALRAAASPNVELRGFISDAELAQLYSQASVYVQASLHEGFGLSVAEAMSGGCVPVVTRVGSLPEVVGDMGVFAASNAPHHIAEAVQRGLLQDREYRLQARRRIVECFSASAREQQVVQQLNALSAHA